MARLVVQFPEQRAVLIDDRRAGETNRVIAIEPGEYAILLEGEDTEPPYRAVTIGPGDDIVHVGFTPASPEIDRFSPLYCRYNGFLLGQFVSLVFAEYGRAQYAERRARMLEFLQEIEVETDIPETPVGLGDDAQVAMILDLGRKLAQRSMEMAEFFLLGAQLVHYGPLMLSEPEFAAQSRGQIEGIREKYGLPELDFEQFLLDEKTLGVDKVLSPSLAWLAKAIDLLDVEEDTAFVIMPFKPPFASYFATFYRPALEEGGYRAFRAWGGLSNEDYCDLLLKLISKCGLVWADVSELNPNVLYEIGAAHAFGKLSMIVVRQDDAAATPANIGHDAVIAYSTTHGQWPETTVLMNAMFIRMLKLAAARGERLRVGPEMIEELLALTEEKMKNILIPAEAYEASKRGRELFEAKDYAAAERSLHDAVLLGLNDEHTRLFRGMSLVGLERYADAEDDLTFVVDSHADPSLRASAVYMRAIAREQQDRIAEAFADYSAAIELGMDDPDIVEARERCRSG
ncbi:MAG TPA: tetratricopeptide repeat protein [Thermoanaerobaculia bacterium]|nr:tetratricopeptide repeat protein [Thermoanaerobaculia bacterium]